MNITAYLVEHIVAEIKMAVSGGFMDKIVNTGDDEWALKFRKGARSFYVIASFSPRNCRMLLSPSIPDDRAEPNHFTRSAKKLILRSLLAGVETLNRDRIAVFEFLTTGGKYFLVAELMGAHGNLYLTGGDKKIIAIALPRKTVNKIGEIYSPPPPLPPKPENAPDDFAPPDGAEFPYSEFLRRQYAEPALKERLERAKAAMLSPLRAELAKIRKRTASMEKEKIEVAKYAVCKKLGDVLQANFTRIKKGAARIETEDIFDPDGKMITIELNPALSPAENIQRYYKKYRKFEKGVPRIESEISAMKSAEEKITAEIRVIEAADDIGAVPAKAVAPKTPSREKAPATKQAYSGPRRFVSSEGYLMLVGRDDRENDELSFRIANGRDLWLHARDYPGSHVLVRLPKGAPFPQKTLTEAAMLALHYSKAAKSGKGEVTYCFAKELKKPKGAPPGKVLVTGAKSVMARIDEEAIRQMKQRAEEK